MISTRDYSIAPDDQVLNNRLVALWALGEAGGGLLSVFKLPLTGMIVTAFAVLALSLLCYYNDSRSKPLLKAWLVIMCVKFAFAPLAPPMAYVAVTFETLLAVFSFRLFLNYRTACVVTAVGSLLQTALMQLFMVHRKVVHYDFWQGAAQFKPAQLFDRLLLNMVQQNPVLTALYLLLFLFVGFLTALIAAELPRNIQRESKLLHLLSPLEVKPEPEPKGRRKRKVKKPKNRSRYGIPRMILIFGVFLLVTGNPKGWGLIRIGMMWLLVFTDFAQKYLINWIQYGINILFRDEAPDVHASRNALPQLSEFIKIAWQNAGQQSNGILRRIWLFVPILFALGMADQAPEAEVVPETIAG